MWVRSENYANIHDDDDEDRGCCWVLGTIVFMLAILLAQVWMVFEVILPLWWTWRKVKAVHEIWTKVNHFTEVGNVLLEVVSRALGLLVGT